MSNRPSALTVLVVGAVAQSPASGQVSSVNPASAPLACGMTFADAVASGAASVSAGSVTIFAGFRQVVANNQDAVVLAFEGTTPLWCRDDLDDAFVDTRATGLLWDGGDRLYLAARQTGAGGASPIRDAVSGGWNDSLVNVGAVNLGVVVTMDPATGDLLGDGSYFLSRLSSGAGNNCTVTGLELCGPTDVLITLDASFSPLRTDLSRMEFTGGGGSPFEYRVRLTGDLGTALLAEAIEFDGVTEFSPELDGCSPILPDPPVVTASPQSMVVDPGELVVLETVAVGEQLTYQWRRDGVDLVDGPGVTGTNTPTLQLVVSALDDGAYDVVVTNPGGFDSSKPAVLAVRTTCLADQNLDGILNGADFNAWLANFALGCGG